MSNALLTALRDPRLSAIKNAGLWLRGLMFLGWKFRCPCCGWRIRGFVGRGGLWHANSDGYCPRCNAKSRHRRHCLYLEQHEELFTAPLRLLEIAPWRSLAQWFIAKANVSYIGLDRVRAHRYVTVVGDAERIPLQDGSCNLVISIHVLEHVGDDHAAIAELYRVLQPGGRAIVSVPLQFDQPTMEDPAITDPAERRRLYGEEEHLRYYGTDLAERLAVAGFEVELELAADLPAQTCVRHGLRQDENIFNCKKSELL